MLFSQRPKKADERQLTCHKCIDIIIDQGDGIGKQEFQHEDGIQCLP